MIFHDEERGLIFTSDTVLSSGMREIARKAVNQIIERIGSAQHAIVPYNKTTALLYEILPTKKDPDTLAITSKELEAGDPECKMTVVIDRLLEGFPQLPTAFAELPLPHGLDFVFLARHVKSNVIIRLARGYDITRDLFIIGVTVCVR